MSTIVGAPLLPLTWDWISPNNLSRTAELVPTAQQRDTGGSGRSSWGWWSPVERALRGIGSTSAHADAVERVGRAGDGRDCDRDDREPRRDAEGTRRALRPHGRAAHRRAGRRTGEGAAQARIRRAARRPEQSTGTWGGTLRCSSCDGSAAAPATRLAHRASRCRGEPAATRGESDPERETRARTR